MTIKQKIILAVTLVFLLTTAIIMSIQPTFNRFNMIVKHTSFFLFFSLLIFTILKLLYHNLLKYDKLQTDHAQVWLKVFTVIVFGGFMFTLSKIQLNYVDTYETPVLLKCSYFDDYGNKLYDSYFRYSCPTLEVEKDNNTIKLSGSESVTGTNMTYYADETRVNGGDINSEIQFYITVTYDNLDRITSYQLKWTQTSIITTSTTTYHGYISLMKDIHNTYDASQLVSDQRNFQYKQVTQGSNDNTTNGHYDFNDAFYVQNKYIVDYQDKVTITKDYIDRHGNQGSMFIGEGIVHNDLIHAEFNTDVLFTDEVFINTILTTGPTGIKEYKMMEPSYGALVYINNYTNINGIAVIKNHKRNFAYGDYDRKYEIYPENSNNSFILEGIFNLHKLAKTEYGYRLEMYDYYNRSWEDHYNSHLRVSPSSVFHVFDYLDYVDLLFDTAKMSEHIIYPYNPILDHLMYYNTQ